MIIERAEYGPERGESAKMVVVQDEENKGSQTLANHNTTVVAVARS